MPASTIFIAAMSAREIAADLERIGSPLTRQDLERYRATIAEPLRVELPSGTVYNTDAPTQGVVSLMILALFARLGVTEAEGFDHIHGLVEATKRALRLRDRVVTDPNYLPYALTRVLDDRFIAGEAMKIDRRKAAPWPPGSGGGDTIWMGAADASGVVVSYIQSLYWEFGSGCVLPSTGVLMQNRGASFSLEAGALNPLAPGRLPFHTLNPALAVLKDGRVMAYGCMGGDGQPQTQSAVFTRHVQFGEPLLEAIDRPRWVLGRTWGAPRTALRMEAALRRQSHRPTLRSGPRCRSFVRALFRRHGPRRRRAAAQGRHLRRRARSARRWRGGGNLATHSTLFDARAVAAWNSQCNPRNAAIRRGARAMSILSARDAQERCMRSGANKHRAWRRAFRVA